MLFKLQNMLLLPLSSTSNAPVESNWLSTALARKKINMAA